MSNEVSWDVNLGDLVATNAYDDIEIVVDEPNWDIKISDDKQGAKITIPLRVILMLADANIIQSPREIIQENDSADLGDLEEVQKEVRNFVQKFRNRMHLCRTCESVLSNVETYVDETVERIIENNE